MSEPTISGTAIDRETRPDNAELAAAATPRQIIATVTATLPDWPMCSIHDSHRQLCIRYGSEAASRPIHTTKVLLPDIASCFSREPNVLHERRLEASEACQKTPLDGRVRGHFLALERQSEVDRHSCPIVQRRWRENSDQQNKRNTGSQRRRTASEGCSLEDNGCGHRGRGQQRNGWTR